ncbi:VOC family protein, partial [Klebsiella pneumoniae]
TDAVLAAAVAAGGRLVKAAEEAFWGGYSGYFADPDGTLWEVAWNPGLLPQPDGSARLSG